MANVQPDAFARATFREIEQIFVFHDAGAGFAVEAMRDHIAGAEDFKNFVVKRRRFAHVNHHRHFEYLGDLLAKLDRRNAP